jgi:protein tyrosine/serine phosphatase
VSGVRYTEVEVIPEEALAQRRATKAAQFAAGVDTDVIMADGYVELLELGAPAFASAVTALVGTDGSPALFHCTAGKDRTGILAALLLQLADVGDDAIAADYALTEERMPAIIERIVGAASFEALSAQVPAFSFQAKAQTMANFLRALDDRWGGAAGYLADIGTAEATITAAGRLLR